MCRADPRVGGVRERPRPRDGARRRRRPVRPHRPQALPIARQVAEALEAAHEAGVIHRDLKPANVKVRPDGTVKVLDFGLAKAFDPPGPWSQAGAGSVANSPTITSSAKTAMGVILGTAAYMAPEQARGKVVDKRADVWAFGAVLFEMLTGRRLFVDDTITGTLAAVLTKEPDFAALPPATPEAVRILLRRCLQRDVRLRLRDIGEARITLSAPAEDARPQPQSPPAPVGRRWPRVLPWALLATTVIVIGWLSAKEPVPGRIPMLRVGIDAGGDTALAGLGSAGVNWVGPTAVLSPDGQQVAFIARGPAGGAWQLYLRRLDELRARALPGTEGAFAPFFSPDGRWLAFFGGGRLSKIALDGGNVSTICPVEEARGGAWAPDNTIVFTPRTESPLFRVPADGGTPTPLTTLDTASGEVTHRWPQVLPDGIHVLYAACPGSRCGVGGVQDGRSTSATIDVQSLAGGPRIVVQRGGLYPRYASSGHLLYLQDGKLLAVPFDLGRLAVAGRPVPVVEDVAHSLVNGSAQFSTSETGLLAYRRAGSLRRVLQWMDLSGQFQSIRDAPGEYQDLRFSPDGRRVALVVNDGGQSDIWVYDIVGDRMSRLTFHADNDTSPVWSPDGAALAYASWRPDAGTFNLFVQRVDGSGQPQRLTTSRSQQFPLAWHPDGQTLLYAEDHPGTGNDIMRLPVASTAGGPWRVGAGTPLLNDSANELTAVFSPDGNWLAYVSDESGRSEVYVQAYPRPGGRWQVSTDGAEWVEWKEQLIYGRSGEVAMSVPYRTAGRTFVAAKPRVWLRVPPGVLRLDPAPDGLRAGVIRSEDTRPESMVLFVNFFEHLRRTAGAP